VSARPRHRVCEGRSARRYAGDTRTCPPAPATECVRGVPGTKRTARTRVRPPPPQSVCGNAGERFALCERHAHVSARPRHRVCAGSALRFAGGTYTCSTPPPHSVSGERRCTQRGGSVVCTTPPPRCVCGERLALCGRHAHVSARPRHRVCAGSARRFAGGTYTCSTPPPQSVGGERRCTQRGGGVVCTTPPPRSVCGERLALCGRHAHLSARPRHRVCAGSAWH